MRGQISDEAGIQRAAAAKTSLKKPVGRKGEGRSSSQKQTQSQTPTWALRPTRRQLQAALLVLTRKSRMRVSSGTYKWIKPIQCSV